MTSEYSFLDTLWPGILIDVRCRVCRDRSLDRYGTRRADVVGFIEWVFLYPEAYPDEDSDDNRGFGPEFIPAHERHDRDVNRVQNIYQGIKARCRYGHDLRVSPERLAKLRLSADGDLYLPGN
jgi:hypothetical protein